MSVEALKEQARRHEQDEQWQKALDLYIKAMDRMSDDDQPDIGLYNRAGDLATRTGAYSQAVNFYERAVDYYVEAELPNNAIAVCKKVMRNLPDRYSIHLKIGQIRAAHGFITDARSSFVTYAERVQADGDIDEAFRALIEFVDLAPNEFETRQLLAAQLAQHERVTEAVVQLKSAHQIMMARGMVEEAGQVEAQILKMSPDATLDAAPTAGVASGSDDGLEGIGLDEPAAEESEFVEVEADLDGLEIGDDEESEDEEAATALPTLDFEGEDDLDFGDAEGEKKAEDVEAPDDEAVDTGGLALDLAEEDEDVEVATTDLPLMSFDDDEPETVEAPEEEVELDAAAFGEADHGDREGTEYVEDTEELPELETGLTGLGDSGEDEDEVLVEAEVSEDESDAEEAVEAAVEESVAEAKAEEAGSDHEALAAEGDFLGAIGALSSVVEAEPDEQNHHQRMVEYAIRSNDSGALAEAYAGLAECLQRAGQDQRAKAVFEQALASDPANERAKAGLGEVDGESEADAAQEVSSAESYVDLGSMLLGDEEEKSTRFVVAYEEPSGDEATDFQKMLSQFREKVSENIDADDATAHYDLGTAFREMGLLDEAIGEFQQALRASVDHLPTYELLGQTFLDKNEPEAAVRSLTRALDAPFEIEDELMGIYYYLAQVHEAVGNKDQAVEFYDRVFSLDINFADVTERLRALRD